MGEVGFGQCVPPLRHLKKGTSKTERFSLVGSAARASVTYMGLDAQKHWTRVESYGPKFVENITQALCRDLLSDAMIRLDDRYRIVAHVHDEVILEVSRETELEEACEIVGRTSDWLPGIELRADGFEAEFYQK